MQIQSTTSVNFGKMGKLGKVLGRKSESSLKNPYAKKLEKITNWYKKQINNTYNSLKDKESLEKEFCLLDGIFHDQISIIQKKRGIRGKAPLEY